MANFHESLEYVLKNEGGFSNKKHDLPTNFGITIKTLSEYLERQASINEVAGLTKERATEVYFLLYWSRLGLSFVNNNNIATAIFDVGVNCGTGTSARLTQEVLCKLQLGVVVDGEIGFGTCEMLDRADQTKFILAFEEAVVQHYYSIVNNHPEKAAFLPGWLARAGRLLSLK